jgi:hypothetical protein
MLIICCSVCAMQNLCYFALSIVGFWYPVAYTFHCLDVIFRSPLLKQVLLSLAECELDQLLAGEAAGLTVCVFFSCRQVVAGGGGAAVVRAAVRLQHDRLRGVPGGGNFH